MKFFSVFKNQHSKSKKKNKNSEQILLKIYYISPVVIVNHNFELHFNFIESYIDRNYCIVYVLDHTALIVFYTIQKKPP